MVIFTVLGIFIVASARSDVNIAMGCNHHGCHRTCQQKTGSGFTGRKRIMVLVENESYQYNHFSDVPSAISHQSDLVI
jgi:hypothetical protein